MSKKTRKILLSNREVEVKLFLEVLAVFFIIVVVFSGIYYLEPAVTGFITISGEDYTIETDSDLKESESITTTMSSLALILIVSLLMYKFVAFKGKSIAETVKKAGEKRKKEAKAKKGIIRKREGKSRVFIKCHKLLLMADKSLQDNDISRAKELYSKTKDKYVKLEYLEKKEIYGELVELYNQLSKGK